MADIFVSYTGSDRDWAFWIGHELEALGHVPHLHDWEISGGGNIVAWMEERHHAADHVLCVVSAAYLGKAYSDWERQAAQWAAATKRPSFALPVFVEGCEAPTLLAHLKRCDLYGVNEDEARRLLEDFLRPAGKPAKRTPFPGGPKALSERTAARSSPRFPGSGALSNIPIGVPLHFLGRDNALTDIKAALGATEGRAAITTLHGLRGVGKTTLAAAYAERHRSDFRATWWIRSESEATMRADLVALGVRLGWIAADDKEQPALAAVAERLRHEGEGILLIFDNAVDANSLQPYLPRGGGSKILITSNSHEWRRIAAPVEIRVWAKETGADYLIARTGRAGERAAAEALSEALGGLPLAHEQAAAYCERLGVSLADYRKRFEAAPAPLLDDTRDTPSDYGRTVAKAFALAIEEAAKLHPAAEPLIVHAALLAPEPIPLFLFLEAREKVGEPLASALAGDGLDEEVAALRAFALVERETIVDERDPTITTDTIRLHRLVRQVAAPRITGEPLEDAIRALAKALTAVYPLRVLKDPKIWPRARRLDGLALALIGANVTQPTEMEGWAANLLDRLGSYRHGPLAAYAQARPLFERALAIREEMLGPDHRETAMSLTNLAMLLTDTNELAEAEPLFRRALIIDENSFGPDHPRVASDLNNIAELLRTANRVAEAEPLFRRALAIDENHYGPDHPEVAIDLNNLAVLLRDTNRLAEAERLSRRALAIDEKSLGTDHPNVAIRLNNLAALLRATNRLAEAEPLIRRALVIDETNLGPDHPTIATRLNNLGMLLNYANRFAEAEPHFRRALEISEKRLGPDHPDIAVRLGNLAGLLQDTNQFAEAEPLHRRALAISEKAFGSHHPMIAAGLNNLALLLKETNRLAEAEPLYRRALNILLNFTHTTGHEHPNLEIARRNYAQALKELGRSEADIAAALRWVPGGSVN
jgi:tetratricopeptide (TPR) repeat protein